MATLEEYNIGLEEVVGAGSLQFARYHIRLVADTLDSERLQALRAAKLPPARRALLDGWYGRFVSDEVKNLVALLAADDALQLLPALAAQGAGERTALVKTALLLSEKLQAWCSEEIRKKEGPIPVRFAVDPSLVGGAVIRVGDVETDASVRAKLQRLAR